MKYDKTKKEEGGNRWNRGRDKLKQGKKIKIKIIVSAWSHGGQ